MGRPTSVPGTVTIAVVSEFFSLWSRMAVDCDLSLLHLLWLLATPFVFALLAYSALPDECPADGLDLTEFYQREHRPWAVLFGLTLVLDIARSADIYLVSPQSFFGYVTATGPFLAFITASLVMIYFGRSRFWSWLGLFLAFRIPRLRTPSIGRSTRAAAPEFQGRWCAMIEVALKLWPEWVERGRDSFGWKASTGPDRPAGVDSISSDRIAAHLTRHPDLLTEIFGDGYELDDDAPDHVIIRSTNMTVEFGCDGRDGDTGAIIKFHDPPVDALTFSWLRFTEQQQTKPRNSFGRVEASAQQQIEAELQDLLRLKREVFSEPQRARDAANFVDGYQAAYNDYCAGDWR